MEQGIRNGVVDNNRIKAIVGGDIATLFKGSRIPQIVASFDPTIVTVQSFVDGRLGMDYLQGYKFSILRAPLNDFFEAST